MLEKTQKFLRSLRVGPKLDLSYLLENADPGASLEDRVRWLRDLIEWLRYRGERVSHPTARVKFLLQLLDRNPHWKERSALVVRSVLRASDATRLFTEVGLPNHSTFGSEFLSRFAKIFIPHFNNPRKMSELQAILFDDLEDVSFVRVLPLEQFEGLLQWLRAGLPANEPIVPALEGQLLGACQILLNRAAAVALREDLTDRAPEFPIESHPLLRAQEDLWELRQAWGAASKPELFERLSAHLRQGQEVLGAVRRHLETEGVSVELIYQSDRIQNDLLRMQYLLAVLKGRSEPAVFTRNLQLLVRELFLGLQYDRDAVQILRRHFGLLARKVVERTGYSGEHYVVGTWREFKIMFVAGLGGGAVTAVTAMIKYAVNTHNWPLFLDFVYVSLNYSVSFLAMHALGFKLATKQPSVTASHLAAFLKEDETAQDARGFLDEVARISRCQFAALLGNLGAVIPVAVLLTLAYRSLSGHLFLSPEKARYVLQSLHPWLSGTLFFAVITGFLLWLSSMTAGWFENATAFYRIPDLIKAHPFLRWWLGAERVGRLSARFAENVSGVVSAVAFGVYLGLIPLIGKFFGLPIEIRHVTLSSGIAASAFLTVGVADSMLGPVLLGVTCIAFLNFSVSFAISLFIAVRAREVSGLRARGLFYQAFRLMLRRPLYFFFPLRDRSG